MYVWLSVCMYVCMYVCVPVRQDSCMYDPLWCPACLRPALYLFARRRTTHTHTASTHGHGFWPACLRRACYFFAQQPPRTPTRPPHTVTVVPSLPAPCLHTALPFALYCLMRCRVWCDALPDSATYLLPEWAGIFVPPRGDDLIAHAMILDVCTTNPLHYIPASGAPSEKPQVDF